MAQRLFAAVSQSLDSAAAGDVRQPAGHGVIPDATADLFDKVHFSIDILPVRRHHDMEAGLGRAGLEPESSENPGHFGRFDGHPQKKRSPFRAEPEVPRSGRSLPVLDDVAADRTPGDLGDETGDPVERQHGRLDVGTSFEPVGGVGRQGESLRRAAHGDGVEVGALEENVNGRLAHHG